ncbi:uncharacterized protein LOC129742323 [Uranotaenia lowii]|uniref:uncharacterized protein LOC129742323 n=1 Tax=Uranotaenia lowii TaxID=190385 RepID=UPI002478974A|nr:uncharacterized protein LOC129742323 [Uranotaenia lowii]
MYTKDYEQKMTELVKDHNTYEKLTKDPTTRFKNKSNDFVNRLFKLNLIDKRTKRLLYTSDSVCPRIYGQPKAHKQNLPLRPVIPNVTAPTHRISKFLANILLSCKGKYNISSSSAFCEEINTVVLPEGYIIVSLDVVSLFTNVPRHLVIKTIIDRWDEIITEINLDLFLEMIEFCMSSSYFQYKNQTYIQTFGTAMGSSLSPILADICLEGIIDRALAQLPFSIPILKKYVDDLFLAIPSDSEQQTLEAFNAQEPRIQFTMETEENNSLPYLDMTVIRQSNQKLITEWYKKSIASGRMLNFNSCHQLKHKVNVARNFIHRVISLSHEIHPTKTRKKSFTKSCK